MNEDSFDREFGRAFPNGTSVTPGVLFFAYGHAWEVESVSLNREHKLVIAHTLCHGKSTRVFSLEDVEDSLLAERK